MADLPEPFPPMVSPSGAPFDHADISRMRSGLGRLDNVDRRLYRDRNALIIASGTFRRLLVVAGPGTGKSHLFLTCIQEWIRAFPGERVYVTSFVRKLIRDLTAEVQNSELTRVEKRLVTVTTLHGLARSLIERNHGCQDHALAAHVRMIGSMWKEMFWNDVLAFHPELWPHPAYSEFERQFFEAAPRADEPWPTLRESYSDLSRFYNAVGFVDAIVHATSAVREDPRLVEHSLWIVDEFQDFNLAEAALLEALTVDASAVMLAGDDDQALYVDLKYSRPEIIRGYYNNEDWAKAMLPLCGRCSYHVARGAAAFIAASRARDSIEKVFLPLDLDEDASRIQVVVCSSPTTAVDYVEAFVEGNRDGLSARSDAIESGEAKDPYLLVLSYSKKLGYFPVRDADRLRALIDEWRLESAGPGPDYVRVLTYYGSGRHPSENFSLRKVLELEGVSSDEVHAAVSAALANGVGLAEVRSESVLAAVAKCAGVLGVLSSTALSADEKTEQLAALLLISEPERLSADLDAFPLGGSGSEDEEAEQVETAGRISPAELLSIVGAKGLSADHVIVLGCDQVNMGAASSLAFYVAMTRARRSLHLLTALGSGGARQPHHFIDAIPENCCDYLKVLKGGPQRFGNRREFVAYCGAIAAARQRPRRR